MHCRFLHRRLNVIEFRLRIMSSSFSLGDSDLLVECYRHGVFNRFLMRHHGTNVRSVSFVKRSSVRHLHDEFPTASLLTVAIIVKDFCFYNLDQDLFFNRNFFDFTFSMMSGSLDCLNTGYSGRNLKRRRHVVAQSRWRSHLLRMWYSTSLGVFATLMILYIRFLHRASNVSETCSHHVISPFASTNAVGDELSLSREEYRGTVCFPGWYRVQYIPTDGS